MLPGGKNGLILMKKAVLKEPLARRTHRKAIERLYRVVGSVCDSNGTNAKMLKRLPITLPVNFPAALRHTILEDWVGDERSGTTDSGLQINDSIGPSVRVDFPRVPKRTYLIVVWSYLGTIAVQGERK